jgi:U3 small nucleolar RNA-associated protein 25
LQIETLQTDDCDEPMHERRNQWSLQSTLHQFRFDQRLMMRGLEFHSSYCSTDFAGRIKLRSTCKGILSQIIPSLRQIFQRVPAQSLATSADERFNYFTKRVLPQIKASPTGGMHTLIFVPSYFDFLRLRKFMREEADMPFAAFSEYDRSAQVTRSRALFFQGRASVMLLTERVTFFKRYKIRGARHFLFYGLPEHEQFYPEFINLVEQGDNSCTVLFNRFDTFALERVVGSERAAKLLQSDKDVHMFC